MTSAPRPIFHLSFPVGDLAVSTAFYRGILGADVGRENDAFVDILLLGAQLTLQHDPANVSAPMPRTRHFGWTLPWDQWELLVTRIEASVPIAEKPTISYPGEPREQGKMMIIDPSGNLIELKAYRHPEQVLGPLAG